MTTYEPLPYFRATVRVEHVLPFKTPDGFERTNSSTLADVTVTGQNPSDLIDQVAEHVGCLSNAYAPPAKEQQS